MFSILKKSHLYDGINWMTFAHSKITLSAILDTRENHSYSGCVVSVM